MKNLTCPDLDICEEVKEKGECDECDAGGVVFAKSDVVLNESELVKEDFVVHGDRNQYLCD